MGELLKPGEPLDAKTKAFMTALWLKTLHEVGEERFDRAFRLVVENSTFRPDIAEIRKAAGVNQGIADPLEKQALVELKFIVAAMRLHGPELKAKHGRLMREERSGETVFVTGPETPAPALSEKTEAALLELGMGSREAGLRLIAGHPALTGEDKYAWKAIADLESAWVKVYREAR